MSCCVMFIAPSDASCANVSWWMDATLCSEQLDRLEILVRQFIERQFDSFQDLWDFQESLINFQIEAQTLKASERGRKKGLKATARANAAAQHGDWKSENQRLDREISCGDAHVEAYRRADALSRQLGDALAWDLLGSDARSLKPLMKNERVSSMPNGHGLAGMMAFAANFANEGKCIPLFHDVTNCLRVGDVTFVRPDRDPLTFEVKTKLTTLDESDNSATLSMTAYTLGHRNAQWDDVLARLPSPLVVTANGDEGRTAQVGQAPARLDARGVRQLERMRNAVAWRAANTEEFFTIGSERSIKVDIAPSDGTFRWVDMRDVCAEARIVGRASRRVEDGLVYVALRSDDASRQPSAEDVQEVFKAHMARVELAASSAQRDTRSSWWFGGTEKYLSGDIPYEMRPFFLYPLPADDIVDLMRGRLVITVFVSVERFLTSIKDAGFEMQPLGKEQRVGTDLPDASKIVYISNGTPIKLDLYGSTLASYGQQMFHEFLSIQGFTRLLSEMARGAATAAERDGVREPTRYGLSHPRIG